MKSLNQFAGNSEVFPNAKVLPPFFQTNLVDSARVVKGFENDPQAYLRIFYYQYLKLCFQLQNVNYDMYIRKIQDIINNPEFNFIFYEHDDPSIFNDNQAKSLIMEFFGVLGEGHFNILKSLSRYPIMDTIFVHFFRSFIILTGITDSLDSYINRDELLDYLCKNFEVQVEIHGECIKFVETDIFVYEVHEAAVYMAYMDYQGENSQLEAQVKQNAVAQVINVKPQPVLNLSVNVSSSLNNVGGNERNKKALVQDSYIASQFVDFTTLTPSNNLASKAKPALKQYELYNQSKETSQKVLTAEVKKVQAPKFQSKYGNITDDYSSKNYGNFTQQKKVTQTTTNYQVNSQLSYQNNSKDTYSNQLKAKETNSYGSYNTNPLYNDTLIQQPKPIEPINSYKNYNPNTAINTNTKININSNINANSNIAFNNTNNNPPFNNHYSNFQPIPTKDTNIKTNININQQVNSQFNTNFNQNFPNNTPLPSSYNNINANANNNNNYNNYNNNNFNQNNNNYNNYSKVQANGINIQNNNNLYNNQSSKSQPVDPKKDIWFNPNINNTLNINTNNNNKNIPPYQPNNNQSIYSTTQPPLVPGVTGKKKPFGLNVSEQFTNQNVMRYMAEPFKSNVEMMRDRARKFRSSLFAYVL